MDVTSNNLNDLGLIPLPSNIEAVDSKFQLNEVLYLEFDKQDQSLKNVVKYFTKKSKSLGFQIKDGNNNISSLICFKIDKSLGNKEEAYTLNINSEKIEIIGSGYNGVFYGIQTLIQILEIHKINHNSTIHGIVIKDSPRFKWRGLMLDVARHMMPIDFIKKCIDIIAAHKLNIFHWHLTEDQGWRIPIKKFPKLSSVSAYRKETLIGHYYDDKPHKFDGVKYGGYYEFNEIEEVIRYASDRYVTVIPEIEMPGHATAALSAYPELSCSGGPHEPETNWGIHKEVYCAGNEETFHFLEQILEEVASIFPGPYIHIGGDECPKDRWSECEKCQKRIKDEGLKNENELQSYFIKRIEKVLLKFNKRLIGWDEILEGGLAPNAVVHSWRGMDGGIEAANAGHEVIMSPTTNVYFDYYQLEDHDKQPLAIGGYLPLSKVYDFEPIPDKIDTDKRHFILGGQANLWTEYIQTTSQAEYMLFPRLYALCEVVWTPKSKKDYTNFISRLEHHLKRSAQENVNCSQSYE